MPQLHSLKVNDHVTQKGTDNPIGVIEDIWMGATGQFARVRWGTADRRTFKDEFPIDDLQILPHKVYSPDEVIKRQAEEAGGKIVEE